MPKATKSVFGRLDVKKARAKYHDVVTGYWEDASDEGGTWNIDGRPDIQGYYSTTDQPGRADLYIDSNGNEEPDDADRYVGYALVSDISTGGYGRWNWSTGAGIGDYFTSRGLDAGKFTFSDTTFL